MVEEETKGNSRAGQLLLRSQQEFYQYLEIQPAIRWAELSLVKFWASRDQMSRVERGKSNIIW